MAVFNVTKYFDTTCPWCFIGDRILEQAVRLYQRTYPGGRDDTFVYTLHPYYLDANAPKQGIPMNQKIAAKNGEARLEAIKSRLSRVGRANGIDFNFEGKTGNTRLSHQLIYSAGLERGFEVQKALLEAVYRMHFEQGGDITSINDLTQTAKAVGIDAADVRRWLDHEDSGSIVDEMAAKARRDDSISAVPTIVINGRRLEGAEDVGTFYEAFVVAKEVEHNERI